MTPANALPHSRQHRCPPSIGNALSIWGLVVLVFAAGMACNGPAYLGCLK